jgi:hypothetical protein
MLKSAQWPQIIQTSSNLTAQLSEMMKTQERFTKSLSRVSKLTELSKSMQQYHRIFNNYTQSAIEELTTGLSLQLEFGIPQSTLDSISSIYRQQDQLFGNLRSITEVLNKNQTTFNQIKSLQFNFIDISSQLAAIAASQEKWDLIDEFEEITEEAVSLNERIFDDNGVTKEGLNELKAFFQRIEIKVDKIDADANSIFWKLLTLLGFILAVIGEARIWLPKPEYATKKEVETVIKEQFGIYEKKQKEDKKFIITSRVCKVMSKPRLKSLVIEKLPIDFEVIVLQVNHKWIYVTYFSPVDNLPQTGWILKKCLYKPE